MTDQRDLAKEVEAITRRANEPIHERHYGQYASDRDSLLAFIASQSRELEEQRQWSAEWHKALETAAVVIEAQSNGSPTEVVESIRARFDSLQSELAALRRPVQSEAAELIRAKLEGEYEGSSSDAETLVNELFGDIRTLLSALDQAQRELSAVRAAANKQGDGDLAELERLRAEIARLSSPPEERGEIVERQHQRKIWCSNDQKTRVDESVLTIGVIIADIDTLLQDLIRYSNAHKILLAERDEARGKVERLEGALRDIGWPKYAVSHDETIQAARRALAAADGQQHSGTGNGVEGE